jgi:hypothetical protein
MLTDKRMRHAAIRLSAPIRCCGFLKKITDAFSKELAMSHGSPLGDEKQGK